MPMTTDQLEEELKTISDIPPRGVTQDDYKEQLPDNPHPVKHGLIDEWWVDSRSRRHDFPQEWEDRQKPWAEISRTDLAKAVREIVGYVLKEKVKSGQNTVWMNGVTDTDFEEYVAVTYCNDNGLQEPSVDTEPSPDVEIDISVPSTRAVFIENIHSLQTFDIGDGATYRAYVHPPTVTTDSSESGWTVSIDISGELGWYRVTVSQSL